MVVKSRVPVDCMFCSFSMFSGSWPACAERTPGGQRERGRCCKKFHELSPCVLMNGKDRGAGTPVQGENDHASP